MIVIADTNVFIDSLFHQDPYCTEILRMEHKGELTFIMTNEMSEELVKTIFMHAQQLGFTLDEFQEPFYKLSRALRRTLPANSTDKTLYCRDPKDDMFIHCAVDESIDFIISSDIHLREKNKVIRNKSQHPIEILKPQDFLNTYQGLNQGLKIQELAKKINSNRL
ncbi:MAG: putative toxin-antitoxin system toxin component, PIN family [Clostridiaceae bacterium]|jgi:putative PIN family toxin of toxin-antitoxin system|nr:putative toxin-antitoxin system toxin component, PIN family [Clostridiaceae bacterium]